MENSLFKKTEDQIPTASGVIEVRNQDRENGENEQTLYFRRRGRKGTAQSAQRLEAAESDPQSQTRIIISKESNRHLDELAARVNNGFEAGKITRPQILSWVLRRFAEAASEEEIQELRAAHFDRIVYLEALLKRAKETGVLPPELQAAIQPPCAPAHVAKKNKRVLTKNTINDDNAIDGNSNA